MADSEDKKVVHVRVTADKTIVEQMATLVSEQMETRGYEVIEQTAAFPSRYDPTTAMVHVTVR